MNSNKVKLVFMRYEQVTQSMGEDEHLKGVIKGSAIIQPNIQWELEIEFKQTVGTDYEQKAFEILRVRITPQVPALKIDRRCLEEAISKYVTKAVSTSSDEGLIRVEGSGEVQMQNNVLVFEMEFICDLVNDSEGAW